MAEEHRCTPARIRELVEAEPGISPGEVARRLGVTAGRVSQVLAGMKSAEVIEQKRNGRQLGLHLSASAMRKQWLRKRWT